jgi:hypothetical protein
MRSQNHRIYVDQDAAGGGILLSAILLALSVVLLSTDRRLYLILLDLVVIAASISTIALVVHGWRARAAGITESEP